ncbi:fibronectin type III domain-containing protein [Cohnella sp.]|uniref:fibronectin type III domain-containing protein n=1 Tax=Cohnella sp. TaxID=1883426 RepID=UPI0035655974
MKRIRGIGLILALFIALIPVHAPQAAAQDGAAGVEGTELIYNGDFELPPAEPGKLEGWQIWPPEDSISVEASLLDPGNRVLKIESAGIPVQWGVSEAHQWVDVLPNHPYKLTADVYFASSVKSLFTLRIDFFDATLGSDHPSGAYISHEYKDIYHPNEGFERIEISGIAPEGVYKAKVELDLKAFEAGASGTVYVDHVSLRHQWAPTRLRLADQTDTSIRLEWDKPSDEAAYSYEIYEQKQGLIGEVDNVGLPANEGLTTFNWEGLPSAVEASRIAAYSFYVVAKPVSNPSQSSLPSNKLRVAMKKPDGVITVMPLGDSLTTGTYGNGYVPGGYRGYLWEAIRSDFPKLLFVGSEDVNPADVEDFVPDHEGHPGYQIARIKDELVDDQVAVYAPDYVILLAGTNNMWETRNADEEYMKANLMVQVKELLGNIRSRLPDTYVIVASIPGVYEDLDQDGQFDLMPIVDLYNKNLKQVVGQLSSEGYRVGFVDIAAMVTERYFFDSDNDQIHPNADGYSVMADVWRDALDAIIRAGNINAGRPGKPMLNPPVLNSEDTSVYLTWGAVVDNVGVDRYEIYRNDEPTAVSVTTATYGLISGLAPSTVYSFSVEAVDKAGNRNRSDSVEVRTIELPDRSPPTAPAELQAEGAMHDRIKLSWQGSTDDVGIREYVANFGGQSRSITNADYDGDNRYSFVIDGLTPETVYSFTLHAVDYAGNASEGSGPVLVETKAAPPGNLRIKAKTRDSLTLAWDPTTDKDGLKEYRLYLDGSLLPATSNTEYAVEGLISGRTYTFHVTAVDELGNETHPSKDLSHKMELYPPSGLVMTEKTIQSLKIRWSPVSGAVKYNVYVNGILQTSVTETQYSADKLNPDTVYAFTVESVFEDGSVSDKSEALELKTDKVPDPVNKPPIFFGGGGGFMLPEPDTLEYRSTDKGVILRFAPSVDNAKKTLNGADNLLALDVPADKSFDLLELELSGEILKLAADKQKPIRIRIGSVTLELPAGWLKIENRDKAVLTVTVRSLSEDDAVKKQSLKPLSSGYAFELRVNGAVVNRFLKPVMLKIMPASSNGADRYGIYFMDSDKDAWALQGDVSHAGSGAELKLNHFSEYAVLAERKSFSDIASHWAREDIEYLASLKIVKGLEDGRFNPSGEVTRAEFAAMLARAFGLSAGAQGALPFEDVAANAWYYAEVDAAYRAGWVQGIGAARFAPADRITREQMAVMIAKAYLQANDRSLSPDEGTGTGTEATGLNYQDAAEISAWAAAYVRLATEEKLVQGIGQSFRPSAYADRAQAAVMISRLLRSVK